MHPPPSVITPGNHDGVHLGHRALVAAARERASRDGLRTVALFFDPHSAAVLAPERAPTLLTLAARREAILRQAGADHVHVQRFDADFAKLSPEAFVEDILVAGLGARSLVVGPDFRFGHRRAGTLEMLRELGERHHFDVRAMNPVLRDGESISSTRVRRVLREGDVEEATAMLGRVHDVSGRVVEGDRRGRTIGFPTANLDCDAVQLPADGVYAVAVRIVDDSPAADGARLFGVANIGVRPTFAAGRSVEVHLFDFDRDIYGARLRVGFVARLRGEREFTGVDALVAQIGQDAESARAALAAANEETLAWI